MTEDVVADAVKLETLDQLVPSADRVRRASRACRDVKGTVDCQVRSVTSVNPVQWVRAVQPVRPVNPDPLVCLDLQDLLVLKVNPVI